MKKLWPVAERECSMCGVKYLGLKSSKRCETCYLIEVDIQDRSQKWKKYGVKRGPHSLLGWEGLWRRQRLQRQNNIA